MESKHKRKSEKDQKLEDVPNFSREFINSNVQYVAENTSNVTTNPWGVAVEEGRKESYWVANNKSETLAKYSSKGQLSMSVTTTGGAPTGLVINKCDKNQADLINISCVARFRGYEVITVTEEGRIDGFKKETNPLATATIVNNAAAGAVYKGVAITKKRLYVANFASGYIEMYDNDFHFISKFTDADLFKSGYAPFNVAVNKKYVYVTFAKIDSNDAGEEKTGEGFGYIRTFSRVGELLFPLVNRGPLNAPWGMLFRENQIYVGNFGDGRVNVFDICSGEWIKAITDCRDNILSVDGLWGIANTECGDIVFAAGIDNEVNGVIGKFKQC